MPNRLAAESSPYLLQHADNPVAWHPWGPEALERARSEDRPILLSVGYSACHWCHVMERESFSDDATAEAMNRAFVCVKVDREERPDVDGVYMRAVQAMTGQGGWPLTAFLTPAGVPFYGGTYFPPERRHGMPSFREVLSALESAWRDRRDEVEASADKIHELLERSAAAPEEAPPAAADASTWRRLSDNAVRHLSGRYDAAHGGFGSAPKFPQPVVLDFLLRHHHRTGAPQALTMVRHTLRRMAAGGMRDHLGGGFHRYSVDARWLVPHFEKMLYDQALLARLYTHAWQATGDAGLGRVAETTLDYVLSDLRDPGGGFYSARDADSEGEEGVFYVWTPEEVRDLLGEEEGALFARAYDVAPGGNFEGRSILWLPRDLEAVARSEDIPLDTLEERLAASRARLLEARAGREPPFRDEKVLSGWSALVVRALADAAGAMDREDYLRAARQGAAFLLDAMRTDGELLHVWTAGQAKVPAFLEDWAALGNALLDLHAVTLEPRWLEEARAACEAVLSRFHDPVSGVFHDTASDAEALVVRPRDPSDSATPSGTSLAVELLLRAGHLFGENGWSEAARRAMRLEAEAMERWPAGYGHLLGQVESELTPPVEVAVIGPPDDPATRALLAAALAPYLPERTVAGADPGTGPVPQLPLLEGRGPVEGRPAAYVCRAYACRTPVTEAAEVGRELTELS
ncbi:MAG: thioredoxin domain-containing protein [Gemmatimonadetes bacterium]|nr:thioredoxin domain-containing protein [Gemmatimonadota bacterium]